MTTKKPTKTKAKPGLSARTTAAERRARRNEVSELRKKINASQAVSQIKSNQAKRRKMLKEGADHDELEVMRHMDDANFKLLNYVLPRLKAVELTGEAGNGIEVAIVKFSDIPTSES